MAQTALPRPVTGLQPHTSLSASTICRPRPASSSRSGILSTGALSDGSSTAHMTSPVRRSRRRPRAWPGRAARAACDTALATNSPTIASASSASEARPQSRRVFRVKRRAVRPDWALRPSAQAATAGESHQSEGIRTTRGQPGAHCSLALRSRGRRKAGSTFVRVGNPTWLMPIRDPAKLVRQPRLIDAVDILPEIPHLMQDRLHVHLYRATGQRRRSITARVEFGPSERPWLGDALRWGREPLMLVAGVDSSTQSTKVLLCQAEDGTVVGQATAPHPDGTECDPQLWWQALGEAGHGLLDRADAIGVAAQQHGMVALDQAGQVIRPALLWNDMRSAPQAAMLIAELGGPANWARRTGSVPTASFTVTKLRWLAEHEQKAAERTAHVLLPHDWLTWRLSGGRGESSGQGESSGRGESSGQGGRGESSGPAAAATDRGDAS